MYVTPMIKLIPMPHCTLRISLFSLACSMLYSLFAISMKEPLDQVVDIHLVRAAKVLRTASTMALMGGCAAPSSEKGTFWLVPDTSPSFCQVRPHAGMDLSNLDPPRSLPRMTSYVTCADAAPPPATV